MASKDLNGGNLRLRKLNVDDLTLTNYNILGNVVFDKNVTITQNLDVQGNLELDGNVTFGGNVMFGVVDVNGVNGNIDTPGDIFCRNLEATGNVQGINADFAGTAAIDNLNIRIQENINSNAQLNVLAGATLNVDGVQNIQNGSALNINAGSSLDVKNNAQLNIEQGGALDFKTPGSFDARLSGQNVNYLTQEIPYIQYSRDNGARLNMVSGYSTNSYTYNASQTTTSTLNIGNGMSTMALYNPSNFAGCHFAIPWEGLNEKAGNYFIWYGLAGSPTNNITIQAVDANGGFGDAIFRQIGNTGVPVNTIAISSGDMVKLYPIQNGNNIHYIYEVV